MEYQLLIVTFWLFLRQFNKIVFDTCFAIVYVSYLCVLAYKYFICRDSNLHKTLNKSVKDNTFNKSTKDNIGTSHITKQTIENYNIQALEIQNKRNIINNLLKNQPYLLKYIQHPTYDMVHIVVSQNGKNLKYFKPNMCFTNNEIWDMSTLYDIATKSDGLALKYVPTNLRENYKVQAIKSNSRALKYFKEQTEEMCLMAIKPNSCVKFIRIFTDNVKNKLVKTNGLYLKYIKKSNQTAKLCCDAFLQNPKSKRYARCNFNDYLEENYMHMNGKYIPIIKNY